MRSTGDRFAGKRGPSPRPCLGETNPMEGFAESSEVLLSAIFTLSSEGEICRYVGRNDVEIGQNRGSAGCFSGF